MFTEYYLSYRTQCYKSTQAVCTVIASIEGTDMQTHFGSNRCLNGDSKELSTLPITVEQIRDFD